MSERCEDTALDAVNAGERRGSEPFFIVGFQRSGTTMLRLMLNAHPEIAIPHDSADLWSRYRAKACEPGALDGDDAVRRYMEELLGEPRITAWQVELPRDQLFAPPLPRTYAQVMRRFHEVFARLHGKAMWGDKNTGTLVELDVLNTLFPACRIVHIVRDGRDCALSHLSKEYVYGYANVLRAALEWKQQVTLCRKMGAMLPRERYLELRYEDLLAAPQAALERICGFLGVDFDPAMLEYHREVDRNVPQDRRSLWPLLDRPPQADNMGKWKARMSIGDRVVFERNAGDLLRELGYETFNRLPRGGHLRELWYHLHERFAWRFKAPAGRR